MRLTVMTNLHALAQIDRPGLDLRVVRYPGRELGKLARARALWLGLGSDYAVVNCSPLDLFELSIVKLLAPFTRCRVVSLDTVLPAPRTDERAPAGDSLGQEAALQAGRPLHRVLQGDAGLRDALRHSTGEVSLRPVQNQPLRASASDGDERRGVHFLRRQHTTGFPHAARSRAFAAVSRQSRHHAGVGHHRTRVFSGRDATSRPMSRSCVTMAATVSSTSSPRRASWFSPSGGRTSRPPASACTLRRWRWANA